MLNSSEESIHESVQSISKSIHFTQYDATKYDNLSMKIAEYIEDVDKELKWVERKLIELQSTDYSIQFIIDEQQYYHEFYKKKMAEK